MPLAKNPFGWHGEPVTKKHKPRSGSLAFYPKKRALGEVPQFVSFKAEDSENSAPLNFFGYKAGMTHVIGTDKHKKSPSFGQKVQFAVTVIECPPLKVFGMRAYKETPYGTVCLGEKHAENVSKELGRRVKSLGGKKPEKKKEGQKKEKSNKGAGKKGAFDFAGGMEQISQIRLLAHTQPKLTGIGKKKPEVVEIFLSGSKEEQLKLAEEKLGGEISVKEAFKQLDFLDIKAVSKGKGFSGVVKRFGVKDHRPKAKKKRVVGSIGPWHPATVMFTVARAGQLGYQFRTEFNKKLLIVGSGEKMTPKGGFKNYGVVKNDYIAVEGSVAGPVKRCVALRKGLRPAPLERHKIEEVELIASEQK